MLSPINDQIEALRKMQWRGKAVRVFVCGDYEFKTKLFGLSGAQGLHPCLWCDISKTEMQQDPSDIPSPRLRTLSGLKEDNDRFQAEGGDKTKAKLFNNAIERPIWDIELEQVVIPWLHILLGVVKKHIVAMEKECHQLDMEIAGKLKENVDLKTKTTTELYRCYVRACKNLEKAEQKLSKYKIRKDKQKKASQKIIVSKLKDKVKKLDYRKGPICTYLAELKKKHNVREEGQHGGSYNGNSCNKFMEPNVFSEICSGIVVKAEELTHCNELRNKANEMKKRFIKLNQRFHFVHKLVGHAKPIQENEIMGIQHAIQSYMDYLRLAFPKESIVPKQHMIEYHCIDWIRRWGFGMGFHGEQGGESLHSAVNKLHRTRFLVVKNKAKQLEYLVKAQHLNSCPDTIPSPPKKQRKTVK